MTEQWPNRIIGTGDVDPEQLLANPANWRIHPQHQEKALVEVLSGPGWVQTVIVNKRTDFVVDGHLRVATAISHGQLTVPVTYVDLSEQEEALILASFDAVTGAAIADEGALARVAAEAEPGVAVQAILNEILSDGVSAAAGDDEAANGAAKDDLPDESTLSWGYATFGKTRVGCSTSEVDRLEDLLQRYKGANNGLEGGFVRWLTSGERPDPGGVE